MHTAVCILRLQGGLDYGKLLGDDVVANGNGHANGGTEGINPVPSTASFPRNESFIQMSAGKD